MHVGSCRLESSPDPICPNYDPILTLWRLYWYFSISPPKCQNHCFRNYYPPPPPPHILTQSIWKGSQLTSAQSCYEGSDRRRLERKTGRAVQQLPQSLSLIFFPFNGLMLRSFKHVACLQMSSPDSPSVLADQPLLTGGRRGGFSWQLSTRTGWSSTTCLVLPAQLPVPAIGKPGFPQTGDSQSWSAIQRLPLNTLYFHVQIGLASFVSKQDAIWMNIHQQPDITISV